MATITLRSVKGSPLTITEMDGNFSNINLELGTKLNITDYTAADILTKIKTVDGYNSGLDADLLDGYNPSAAGTANTIALRNATGGLVATTFTGNLTGNVTGNVTGNADTVTNGLYTSNIGTTVQAYDADTAKLDTVQTWTATQTYGDNVYQQFGAGGDLLIYHNGSDSYIRENGTGNFVIGASDSLYIRNSANNLTSAIFTPNGSVNLRYNSITKLETTNTGVDVTGTLNATSNVTINGSSVLTSNQTITLSGDITGSGTTAITTNIASNAVGANELNVTGNGTAGQFLSSDGDGSMSWTTQTQGIGVGQTWQDVTASRALNTTYTNTTGRPIMISIYCAGQPNHCEWELLVDGIQLGHQGVISVASAAMRATMSAIVPAGSTYRANNILNAGLQSWAELR